jgi:hypothetical protein
MKDRRPDPRALEKVDDWFKVAEEVGEAQEKHDREREALLGPIHEKYLENMRRKKK